MNKLKLALALGGSILLSACNMVISSEPMLVRAPDTPVMKPGIWIDGANPDCDFDPATQPHTWPECADPAIVTAEGKFFTYDEQKQRWSGVEVVLDNGDPNLVQVSLPGELTSINAEAPKFIYMALRPLEIDEEGRFTAISTWVVFCGPMDKEVTGRTIEDAVTKEPFEGLKVAEGNCSAESVEALRNAASKSERLDDKPGIGRWLRAADDVELD